MIFLQARKGVIPVLKPSLVSLFMLLKEVHSFIIERGTVLVYGYKVCPSEGNERLNYERKTNQLKKIKRNGIY